jgi:hypothetical protein
MPKRCLGCLLVAACCWWLVVPSGRADGEKPQPPVVSAAASSAVLASLDATFTESWGDGVVFIEAGPHVPAGLNRVGKSDAEVVTVAELERRFEGKPRAPSLARVRVGEEREKDRTVYSVEISYAGLPVKGSKSIPIGGGRWFKYTVEAGKVTLVDRGAVKY